MEEVPVAVGVLERSDGRVLLTQRGQQSHLAGYWEFPGGKMEPGEDAQTALRRELREELGIRVTVDRPLIDIHHAYPDLRVHLQVRKVTAWEGEPLGLEGQPLAWVRQTSLEHFSLPDANQPIIGALALPDYYLISPPTLTPNPETPVDTAAMDRFMRGLEAGLAQGYRLVLFRVFGLTDDQAEALARQAIHTCHAAGARLLMHAPTGAESALAVQLGADGMHLPARRLPIAVRPVLRALPMSVASCHTPEELALAEALGVDFALLSPVAATPSHPKATPLGWSGFTERVATTKLPVYALGGLTPADLTAAREAGAQGVAGIRGFWPDPDA